jgi:hypothetical protein
MSYEEASRREIQAFETLKEAVAERAHVDAKAAVYSDHAVPYEERVQRLLAAVQAYEAASSDLLKARTA